jgi:hypothetical protein
LLYEVRRRSVFQMVLLAGIAGALIGFLVGFLITQVIIGEPPNAAGIDWGLWTEAAYAVVGALVSVRLGRKYSSRSRRG